MADGVKFRFEGAEELKELLKDLSTDMARRSTSRAVRKSLSETRDKAKANAQQVDNPDTKESIAGNIATRVSAKRFKYQGVIKGSVGVRGGAKKGKEGKYGDTWYWRLLEFGTSRIRARPMLRPAFNPSQVTDAFSESMRQEIAKEIAKHPKHTKR